MCGFLPSVSVVNDRRGWHLVPTMVLRVLLCDMNAP